MALSAQKFREIVFQMLYSIDLGNSEEHSLVEMLSHELLTTKKNCKEAFERASQVMACKSDVDVLIAANATSYQFDRIYTVERNILRLGLYELMRDEKIPDKVAIAEALRLTKKFSTHEAIAFVNAILDAIYRQKGVKGDESSAISEQGL